MKMPRFAPYLGIVAALATGVLIAIFSGGTTVVHAPVIFTIPAVSSVSSTQEVSVPAPEKNTPPQQAPVSAPVAPTPPAGETAAEINAKLDISAALLRGALVNIICTVPAGSGLHSISGSGIVIDSKGIILTNAHIAQYFLLADKNVSCTIRTGSPARDSYHAALIYISPAWLRANPNVLTQTNPFGTGEYDFAFLAVSESAVSSPLPSSFPYLPLATMPPAVGAPVVIASYGAQFLESSQVQSELSPTIVFGSVKDVFTFSVHTIDVLALGGSAAAQEGSSGGGVADVSNMLVGTITTSTITGTTDTRALDAITAYYIRAEYATETGEPLEFLLAKSPATAIADFASQIPALEAIITANLP